MFRRRRRDENNHDDDASEAAEASPRARQSDRSHGPYDADEVDLDKARETRVDLGALLVNPRGGQLQLQRNEGTEKPIAAIINFGDAAVQLMVVGAPRSSLFWEEMRMELLTSMSKQGARTSEGPGPFGTEARVVSVVTSPEGKQVMQPSRVSGIDGPRWTLRANFLGKATTDADALEKLVEVVRDTVVVRGDKPVAPGDILLLTEPETT